MADLEIPNGKVIISEGDDGGDIYFIKEGIVEVFVTNDGKPVVIAELKKGDVLGLLTVITHEARTASARAKGPVVVTQVTSTQFEKLIGQLPPWLNTIVKECTTRVRQMNESFSRARAEIETLRKLKQTKLTVGVQMAGTIAALMPYIGRDSDGKKIALADEVLDKVETILLRSTEEIHQIFDVLTGMSVIKLELDPGSKKKIITLDSAKRAMFFPEFYMSTKKGKHKKFLETTWMDKEKRMLTSLVRYAKQLDMDLTKEVKLPLEQLRESLERVTQQAFDQATITKGKDAELLKIEFEGSDQKVVFNPQGLSRAFASMDAMRQLEAIETVAPPEREEKDEKKEKAAAGGKPVSAAKK